MANDLVVRAQRGDPDAFALLAGTRIGRLDAAARLILRDPDRAKDAVQEALLRAWRDLPALRDPDRFDAWLHRLLAHSCHDELRRARRRPIEVELTPMHDSTTPDASNVIAARDEIERGFRALSPGERAVVVLHYYLGMPLSDAAVAMGVPVGTAKSRLNRALDSLRSSLDAEHQEDLRVSEGRPA